MTADPTTLPAGPDRLEALVRAGRISRDAWGDTDAEGREYLCWLSALSDEVRDEREASACPASVAPAWLAELVPDMCDSVDEGDLEALGLRLAATARGIPRLSPEAVERARVEALCGILDEGLRHCPERHDQWGVREAVAAVQRALRSGEPLQAARSKASEAQFRAGRVMRCRRASAAFCLAGAAKLGASGGALGDSFRLVTQAAHYHVGHTSGAWSAMAEAVLDALDAEIARVPA